MFAALRALQFREPAEEDYQVPAIDVLNDTSGGVLVVPPDAPTLVAITGSGMEWETVASATGYYLEALSVGTIWQQFATVNQAAPVQVLWDGNEWVVNVWANNLWATVYHGVPAADSTVALTTPDLVTESGGTWQDALGNTVDLDVTLGGPVGSGGITISGATNSLVNGAYEYSGNINGLSSYSSPEVATYSFTPSADAFYRVRAFNSAGPGPASNTMIYVSPPVDIDDDSGKIVTDDSGVTVNA